jgi:mannosyltransferase OCH1-like enzyme
MPIDNVLEIPRTFHRIWVGPHRMPKEFEVYGQGWLAAHPGWNLIHWTEGNLPPARWPEHIARCRFYRHRANIYRYQLLLEHGGVYLDTDLECKKNIEPLLVGVRAFAAYQIENKTHKGCINNAFMGGVAGHPFLKRLVDLVPAGFNLGSDTNCGPYYITAIAKRRKDVTIFPKAITNPFDWNEVSRRGEEFPDAYMIHHWSSQWLDKAGLQQRVR